MPGVPRRKLGPCPLISDGKKSLRSCKHVLDGYFSDGNFFTVLRRGRDHEKSGNVFSFSLFYFHKNNLSFRNILSFPTSDTNFVEVTLFDPLVLEASAFRLTGRASALDFVHNRYDDSAVFSRLRCRSAARNSPPHERID